MSTSLQFAIIGCGKIAQRHAQHIHAVGKLVAVCDVEVEKADALATQYHCKAYYSFQALLATEKNIDVVAICTPNGLHAQHTILCLQAGMHVLCEKPMAINTADCKSMIAAAEKANKQLFIVKQNRFNPPVMAVKNALENKILGKILSIQLNCFWNRDAAYYANSWKGTKAMDGGTLFTQFSHFIDLLYWLFGEVKPLAALTNNAAHQQTIEFEDNGVVLLQLVDGIIGSIHYTVNSYQKNMEGSLTIFGEKGTVKIGGQYLNELEYALVEDYSFGTLPKGNVANDYGTYTGSMSNHDKVYANVVDVLQNGAAISANAWDGLKTVEIIENIYQLSTNNF